MSAERTEWSRSVTSSSWGRYDWPMPNDTLGGATVVASVIYSDDDSDDEDRLEVTVLLLENSPPFFAVGVWNVRTREFDYYRSFVNIVDAVRDYEQCGGDRWLPASSGHSAR